MSKRRRFVATSVILSLGFIGIQFLTFYKIPAIFALALLTIGLFYWSLYEGLGKNMTLLTLILPAFFTVGVGTFWFLLTGSIFARLPIVIFYGVGIYVLCLTSNIYTVAAIRTIALLRAARGVGFVLTLVTSFLVFDAILSLRVAIPVAVILVAISSFPLFLQGYWSILLQTEFSRNLIIISGVSGLVMGEVALGLAFWPVTVVVGSLFMTVAMYMLLGLGQAKLESRLFSQTVREYLVVGILVFIGMFLATHWGQ
ncbi:hypothetical protein MUP46_04385 [Patescibacteria group bacterium]|nr:hypothetical protein [Patescibacteria group bacterium]